MRLPSAVSFAVLLSLVPGLSVDATPRPTLRPSLPALADQATVRIDSARHLVVISAGPWDLAPAPTGQTGPHAGHFAPSPLTFIWPVNGWLRGVRLKLINGAGEPVSRDLLHHITLINLGRRELLFPVAERIIALGKETADIHFPATVGIPVSVGMPMALAVAWMNKSGATVKGAKVEFTLEWMPATQMPRPVSVLPVTLEVSGQDFEDSGIDLPPGIQHWTQDYVFPVGGHILAAGGHMHDYATGMTLNDITATSDKPVLSLASTRDAQGKITGLQRMLPGVFGDGIRVQQGHTYRMAGSYDNPTGAMIAKGGMVSMVLIYAPDRMERWPAPDPTATIWKRDLASLFESEMAGMPGMDMGHNNR